MKLPAHKAGPFGKAHGPEYIEWASREESFLHIVPLNPAYMAGLAGHVPAKKGMCPYFSSILLFNSSRWAMVPMRSSSIIF